MAEQRYRVLERLESGGMAEVFRAEAAGVQGFRKKVAIKRVLPHLAQNTKFISMFLDEARLGARLNHANIVTVFDIGAADGTYFIVMEYIEGANLKNLMETLRAKGQQMPLKYGVYVCMEACRGLSYAHELTDDDGRPLNIVHRDVSPPNIMLSRRGEVKLTDFGLAKAATQLEKTDPGVVKGKFSYLSPEAAYGQNVDARADIFALGIVLWEMAAGQRLFVGNSDYETVRLVQKAHVPDLLTLNPDVDPDINEIIMRSLSRDPQTRYTTAREFGDALAGYLFNHRLKVTAFDIAGLIKHVGPKPTRRKSISDSIIGRLIQEELLRFTSLEDLQGNGAPGASPLDPADVDGARPINAYDLENPAEWFKSDVDVSRAVERHRRISESGLGSVRWVETGLDPDFGPDTLTGNLANALESERKSGPPRASGYPIQNHRPKPAAQQNRAVHSPLPTKPKKKRSRWKFAAFLFVLLLAGAGAAAWFSGMLSPWINPKGSVPAAPDKPILPHL